MIKKHWAFSLKRNPSQGDQQCSLFDITVRFIEVRGRRTAAVAAAERRPLLKDKDALYNMLMVSMAAAAFASAFCFAYKKTTTNFLAARHRFYILRARRSREAVQPMKNWDATSKRR